MAVTECFREEENEARVPSARYLLSVLFTHHRTESTGCCLIFRKNRAILRRTLDSVYRLVHGLNESIGKRYSGYNATT
jgi:hypothetical protein